MTVSNTLARVSYMGTGAPVVFHVPFIFFEETDLVVMALVAGVETTQVLGTNYTVTGGDGAEGDVIPVGNPAVADQWTILRQLPLTQEHDYQAHDPFPAESHEDALDLAALRDQQLQEQIGRAIKAPTSDDIALDMTLPPADERASAYLGFDGDGAPIPIAAAFAGSIVVTPYMLTLLDEVSEASFKQAANLEIGVDVQAADSDLTTIAGLTKTNGNVIFVAGGVWTSAALTALIVTYSDTTTGYGFSTVQAAIGPKPSSITKKASDEIGTDFSTEKGIAGLTGITVPGTPDGVRKYRAGGQVLIIATSSSPIAGIVRVRVGTLGTASDPIVWEGETLMSGQSVGECKSVAIVIPEWVPGAGAQKLTVTLDERNNNNRMDVRGDATVLESYIGIEMK